MTIVVENTSAAEDSGIPSFNFPWDGDGVVYVVE